MTTLLHYLFGPEARDYSGLQSALLELHQAETERSARLVANMKLTREITTRRWNITMGVAA